MTSLARPPRAADYGTRFQVAAVVIAITGVMLLAVAAFLVSYAGIRQIAVAAGVSPALAGLYPLMVDAALVVACVAALALRGAGWQMQGYAWLSVIFLLAAVAVAGAVHAAGVSLPHRPAAAAVAALPWVLFLLGFGLCLSVLRHLRAARAGTRQGIRALHRGGPGPRTQTPPMPLLSPPSRSQHAPAPIQKTTDVTLSPPAPEPAGSARSEVPGNSRSKGRDVECVGSAESPKSLWKNPCQRRRAASSPART